MGSSATFACVMPLDEPSKFGFTRTGKGISSRPPDASDARVIVATLVLSSIVWMIFYVYLPGPTLSPAETLVVVGISTQREPRASQMPTAFR